MNPSDLVFSGFNRRVAALHRLTGSIVWEWRAPKGSSHVSLLLEPGLLVVSVDGYMYGLDPLTGGQLWYNEMKGFGTGGHRARVHPRAGIHAVGTGRGGD